MKKLSIADIEISPNENFCVCTLNQSLRCMHNFVISKEALIQEMNRLQIKSIEVLTTLNGILTLKFF